MCNRMIKFNNNSHGRGDPNTESDWFIPRSLWARGRTRCQAILETRTHQERSTPGESDGETWWSGTSSAVSQVRSTIIFPY